MKNYEDKTLIITKNAQTEKSFYLTECNFPLKPNLDIRTIPRELTKLG